MSHARIATVHEADRHAAAEVLAGITSDTADIAEIRLDALWPAPPDPEDAADDLEVLLDAAQVPLLATLRPKRQGGGFEGEEDVRVGLLLATARIGFPYVDLENEHPAMASVMGPFEKAGIQVALSDHRFPEAPGREEALRRLLSMQDLRGRLDKIAFPVSSFMDDLRAIEVTHAHAHRRGRPAVAPVGGSALLRALLSLVGNHATYGAAGRGAPGQPALAQIEEVWRHWGITRQDLPGDPEAGWFAVAGDPVRHSLSPRIHNAMLRHAGRRQRYGALRVPDSIGAMRLLLTVSPRLGLRGLSITAPLKRHALAVTAPDATARAVGAVNCVRIDGDGPHSTNTDATAMRRLLKGVGSVAVLGAGGAAAAAGWAAQDLGIPVTFVSRTRPEGVDAWVPWDQRASLRAEAWVQATPLAHDVLPADALEGAQLVVELAYGQGTTALEQAAAAAGIRVVSGRRFLIEQATDAYRFWTGDEADRQVMEAALP